MRRVGDRQMPTQARLPRSASCAHVCRVVRTVWGSDYGLNGSGCKTQLEPTQPHARSIVAADGPSGHEYALSTAHYDKLLRERAGGDAMASRREDRDCGGADSSSNNREGVQQGDAVATPPPAPGGSARYCRVSAPKHHRKQSASCNLHRPQCAAGRGCRCSRMSVTMVVIALARRCYRDLGLPNSLLHAPNCKPACAGGWLRRQHSRGEDILSASTLLPGKLQVTKAIREVGRSRACELVVGIPAVHVSNLAIHVAVVLQPADRLSILHLRITREPTRCLWTARRSACASSAPASTP